MNRTKGLFYLTSIVVLAMLVFLVTGCRSNGRTLPSATGSIYEIVVVSDEDVYKEYIQPVMEADMPCLPQMESYFHLTHVTPKLFDDFLNCLETGFIRCKIETLSVF